MFLKLIILIPFYYIILNAINPNIDIAGFLFAMLYIFIPLIFIPVFISISSKRENEQKNILQQLELQGFTITHKFHEVLADSIKQKLFFIKNKDNSQSIIEVKFADILGTNIICNESIVLKTEKQSVLGRALIGGVILGGVGALLGGISASEKTTSHKELSKLTLEIIVNDIDCPIHRIDFLNHQNELEVTQIMFELIMMGVELPKQNGEVNFLDVAKMLKIRTERF